MKCIGINKALYLCFCACIMRQIKGCDDKEMKSGKIAREKFVGLINQIEWDQVKTCYSDTGNDYNEPRVCLCFNKAMTGSCDPCMKPENMSRNEFFQRIDAMIC